jgi:hypothetical protein
MSPNADPEEGSAEYESHIYFSETTNENWEAETKPILDAF